MDKGWLEVRTTYATIRRSGSTVCTVSALDRLVTSGAVADESKNNSEQEKENNRRDGAAGKPVSRE